MKAILAISPHQLVGQLPTPHLAIIWQRFDGLIQIDGFTAEELVQQAMQTSKAANISFSESFDWVVDYLASQRYVI